MGAFGTSANLGAPLSAPADTGLRGCDRLHEIFGCKHGRAHVGIGFRTPETRLFCLDQGQKGTLGKCVPNSNSKKTFQPPALLQGAPKPLWRLLAPPGTLLSNRSMELPILQKSCSGSLRSLSGQRFTAFSCWGKHTLAHPVINPLWVQVS